MMDLGIPLATERVKPGLSRVRRLLSALGEPQGRFPAIHVGGTNGKGSVVAFLESVFIAAGYRVGAYTSPDLGDPTERIRVRGERIPEGRLRDILRGTVGPLPEEERPTYFEAMTAAAYAHFAAEGVDLAVVEVGLGGRFDATNCLPRKLLSLVTSVELDHPEFFGPGYSRAAWEKAGIAAQGVPFLTVERKVEVLAIFAREAKSSGSALVLLDPDDIQPVELSWERAVWRSREDPLDLGEFETGLVAAYQRGNIALVLGALRELVGGWEIPKGAIREGLYRARWPGRFEVVSRRPYIVLDGAHNPAGARALLESLRSLPEPSGRRILLFGTLREKPIKAMAEILFPHFHRVVLVAPDNPRALPSEALLHQARRLGVTYRLGGGVRETLRDILSDLGEDDLLVVTGSLYTVAEARHELYRAP